MNKIRVFQGRKKTNFPVERRSGRVEHYESCPPSGTDFDQGEHSQCLGQRYDNKWTFPGTDHSAAWRCAVYGALGISDASRQWHLAALSFTLYAAPIRYLAILWLIHRCFRRALRRSALNRLDFTASIFRNCTIACVLAASFAACPQQSGPSIAGIESLIRSKQYVEALRTIDSGLHEKPSDFRLWTLKGIVLSIQNRTADALKAFDEALRYSPGYPAALRGKVAIFTSLRTSARYRSWKKSSKMSLVTRLRTRCSPYSIENTETVRLRSINFVSVPA